MEIKPWLKYKIYDEGHVFPSLNNEKKMVLKTTNLGRPHLKNDHLSN